MPWILCAPGLISWPASFWVITGAFLGLHGHGEKFLALGLLPKPGDAGDGAAGADAGDQDIHLAVGVIPDFRAGGLFVDGRIGRVFELLRQEVVFRIGGGDFFGAPDGAPSCPSAPGVSSRLAPKAASTRRRSRLMVSGMVRVSL